MQDDLTEQIRTLSTRLRDTDSFTETVAHWLNSRVDYISLCHEYCLVTPEHAAALDVSAGSKALYRRGYLEAESTVFRQRVADVRAVVVEDRLHPDARQSLESKKVPLGRILSGHGMRRHTHDITRVSTVDANGRQVLRVAATVTIAGELVAAVDEIVYLQLFKPGPSQCDTTDDAPVIDRLPNARRPLESPISRRPAHRA
ncbi:hypothetical protein [Saccharopolyspora sp. ASAGF58]|uniref:hypothetical protein n=1 Tax=Saccharopolyspora sp. ASAGF58 TaxID=2719023 RepID=UPI00143FC81A|nr:hypothetical protein [Saccharopolyspora sp. ASAGF58]QIZ37287.1 hypothetical protein FDZ84_25075 [Saccharopolyspora sp. ASAGF58]